MSATPVTAIPDDPPWIETAVTRLLGLAPALLHGVRLWCAVCLALYLAFSLDLQDPVWAGMSAAIVCQPSLGASLRRSSFRLVGTVAGAAFPVLLAALFPQWRVGFMAGLALWGGACGFMAMILADYAAYAAALAGYTAAIVGAIALGSTGGIGSDIFMTAVLRASEISVGILAAGIVVGVTTIGKARHTLIVTLCHLCADVAKGLDDTCLAAGEAQATSRPKRHALVSRIVATSPQIEDATGEEYDLLHNRSLLRAATTGLMAAMSGWRTVANTLEGLPVDAGTREVAAVRQLLPAVLQQADGELAGLAPLRQALFRAARQLVRLPAETPSLRLIADGAAQALLGLNQALDCIAWLEDPAHPAAEPRRPGRYVPDLLPALVAAVRAAVTIGVIEAFWIGTAWTNGGTAISFAAISVILFSPRGAGAYAAAQAFCVGGVIGIVAGVVAKFGVLPLCTNYESGGLLLAAVLVPIGTMALIPIPSVAILSTPATIIFLRVLGPDNSMSYDGASTWNFAIGVLVGSAVAALSMVLIPPLSPATQANRAVRAELRDLRRLLLGRGAVELILWEHRGYRRLASLPAGVDLAILARYVATMSLGTAVLRLRRLAERFGAGPALEQALQLLADGRRQAALEALSQLEQRLDQAAAPAEGPSERLRALGHVHLITATLSLHADHFDLVGSV